MRFAALKIYVVLFICCVMFFVPDSFAQKNNSGRKSVVLSSPYKIAPNSVNAKADETVTQDQSAKIRLVGRKKVKPAVIASSRSLSGKARWAALPISEKLSAQSAIVMDGVTGRIIYAQSPDRARQPASTIKVLTGMLAIESLRNTDKIFPSRRAARMPRSKIYLNPQKWYVANDLINAVLLSSANDASVALAEEVSGSERNFAAMMTAKARSLGARNTICKNATGLTAKGQQSTARDLAIIFNKAMDGREFAGRVGQSKVRTGYGKVLWNHNKALWQVNGAEGGKTGYTDAARQTYVGKFKRAQGEVVIALMGSETMWDDVKNLVEYGFAQMKRRNKALPSVARVDDVAARIATIQGLYTFDLQQSGLRILVADKNNSEL